MLDFSEEERTIQTAIRTYCAQQIEPKVLAMEAGEASVYPVMRDMANTFGLPDMARAMVAGGGKREENDTEKGPSAKGLGINTAVMSILMMELARVCPGFALAFGASLGLFGGAVMARGTREQKERWALPVFTMEKIGAWGLTEPSAGSDAFGSMKTRARKVPGGYRLHGSKTFITNAPFADYFVIYARLEHAEGAGAVRSFIVERSDEGLTTGPPMKKMGMHASPTGEIFLDDVFVPAERVIGRDDTSDARQAARSSLQQERFAMIPMLFGIVDRCLEECVRFAKSREQWGNAIASFQLVQEKIARIYTARTVMHALWMRQIEAERKGVHLPAREASAAKLYAARATTECALEAVQIFGGSGYMTGSVVEMMARDAKLFQIGGGTDEIQILRIARELLEP
ncbi:acyl-CoA dehydrogenase family protein [Pendulispora rubella]|uniref:Acyl-CoA dehydrogenase family protein n=1 Tax=Pendulispora rubella TaxID=2741070 RepID=A0ABZ2LAT6_9BACT